MKDRYLDVAPPSVKDPEDRRALDDWWAGVQEQINLILSVIYKKGGT